MTIRTYIITFYGPTADVAGFNHFVTTNKSAVLAYWNYIPLVYFIKSEHLASQLAAIVAQYFPQGQLVIAEINPQNLDGRLPKEAWEWFYAPTPGSSALGGGLGAIALGGGVGPSPLGGGLGALSGHAIPPIPGGMPGTKPRR